MSDHPGASTPGSAKPATTGKRSRVRGTPKGRRVDTGAREQVVELLGDDPRRRDLLIEYLHRIQDRFGHLSDAHLVALAEELRMAMAEVYEVATFYHHFDVVKDGGTAPPAITVRVCDSIACELAGAKELLAHFRRHWASASACCTRRASAAAKPHPWRWWDRTRCRTRPWMRSRRWSQRARPGTMRPTRRSRPDMWI